jgi:multimeric flavodoxin WrbA
MSNMIVVVTFYSRGGATETLAHAAAVGAVQARAGIRLRRMPDADEQAILERLPECRDTLRRMHREYVAPREVDVLAADALIVGAPADIGPASPEWAPFVALLEQMHASGKLSGKVAAAITTGPSSDAFDALVRRLGFTTIADDANRPDTAELDDVSRAVALGRHVVTLAEKARAARAVSQ